MKELKKFLGKLPNWLRWVILLPALFVLHYLLLLLVAIFSSRFLSDYITATSGAAEFLRCLAAPTLALIVATAIAPKGKFVVGVLVSVFYVIISVLLIIDTIIGIIDFGIFSFTFFEIINVLAGMAGSILAVIVLIGNKEDYAKEELAGA